MEGWLIGLIVCLVGTIGFPLLLFLVDLCVNGDFNRNRIHKSKKELKQLLPEKEENLTKNEIIDSADNYEQVDNKPEVVNIENSQVDNNNDQRIKILPTGKSIDGFYYKTGEFCILLPYWDMAFVVDKKYKNDLERFNAILEHEKQFHYIEIESENGEPSEYLYINLYGWVKYTKEPQYFVADSLFSYEGNSFYNSPNKDDRDTTTKFKWNNTHSTYKKLLGGIFFIRGMNGQSSSFGKAQIGFEDIIEKVKDCNDGKFHYLKEDKDSFLKYYHGSKYEEEFFNKYNNAKKTQNVISTKNDSDVNIEEYHVIGVQFDGYKSGCYYYYGDNNKYQINDRVLVPTSNNGNQLATVVFRKVYKRKEEVPYSGNLKKVIRKL